ncbi:4-alpha-glucanotransferase [Teredinibacter turnerae]|uniref:4-alpha-glucanotransferase n=1 Tax=Teredinibacter turnerae TaxID=2426 RepID=UPI0030CEFE8C
MSDLDRLFYWRGIASDYFNYRGEHVTVPVDNRLNLLATMGQDISNSQAIAEAAYELDVGPWRHFVPPLQTCVLHDPGQSAEFYVNLHPARLAKELAWELRDSNQNVIDKGALLPKDVPEVGDYVYEAARYSRRQISTNVTEPGYYTLTLSLSSAPDDPAVKLSDAEKLTEIEACLAVAPGAVYQPSWLETGEKLWGFIVQLYTLRSDNDWGIGDFSDLKTLIVHAADAGADLIGLNPLHALLPDVGTNNSPYSPSDRRFINTLYIDPTAVHEFSEVEKATGRNLYKENAPLLSALRDANFVDYASVKNIKYPVFEVLFNHFYEVSYKKKASRYTEFCSFLEEAGEPIYQFARFESIRNSWQNSLFAAIGELDIPDGIGDLESLSLLTEDTQRIVLFHCYLQWLAHVQLEACQIQAVDCGMKVGLIRDLAVGAEGGGAEVYSQPGQFCTRASVGAPPDPLAEQGQNWGLPPMDPAFLRETGYAHFIQILRENMSLCGALRIDHAMSLMRLWWCPPGTTADHGAYVYYPFEDMLALLCLESYLNQCAIVGEDLGVVPPEFREAITRAGIFTNRVFYFEKENYSYFKPPENYDVHALAMVNNHDVPTLTSWWNGNDLVLRDKLGIFEEGVDYETMVEQRRLEKQQVLDFLLKQGELPPQWLDLNIEREAEPTLINAILATVSRVASRLYVIQLEDVLLMDAPVNVPGTFKEYPNWQRKLSQPLDVIFNQPQTQALLARVHSERNR